MIGGALEQRSGRQEPVLTHQRDDLEGEREEGEEVDEAEEAEEEEAREPVGRRSGRLVQEPKAGAQPAQRRQRELR